MKCCKMLENVSSKLFWIEVKSEAGKSTTINSLSQKIGYLMPAEKDLFWAAGYFITGRLLFVYCEIWISAGIKEAF